MPHQLLKSRRKQAGPKMASRTATTELWSPRMEEILGLNKRALDRARMSRDARFDGKFFIAITSTRIYCRPICPSPHARRRHVRYYPSAAAAAAAGYRPCLRCRPEAAPGTPAWLGTSAVVRRGLRRNLPYKCTSSWSWEAAGFQGRVLGEGRSADTRCHGSSDRRSHVRALRGFAGRGIDGALQ